MCPFTVVTQRLSPNDVATVLSAICPSYLFFLGGIQKKLILISVILYFMCIQKLCNSTSV